MGGSGAVADKDQLDVIGNAMDKERGIVHKYTTLNCAAYMETDTIVEVLQEFRERADLLLGVALRVLKIDGSL